MLLAALVLVVKTPSVSQFLSAQPKIRRFVFMELAVICQSYARPIVMKSRCVNGLKAAVESSILK
ncbi:MAG: hypothetical protein AAFZ49_17550, partial [Cyanobacteria bacterium J06659_2]